MTEKAVGLGDLFADDTKYRTEQQLDKAQEFCLHVAEGCNQGQAAEKAGISVSTVTYWRSTWPRFTEMFEFALKERAFAYQEELIEIADDATDDAIMGPNGPIINGKAIRRAEIMIKTRQWVMAKADPKKYGDKSQMELTGADGKDLTPQQIVVQLIPSGNFISEEQATERLAAQEDTGVSET